MANLDLRALAAGQFVGPASNPNVVYTTQLVDPLGCTTGCQIPPSPAGVGLVPMGLPPVCQFDEDIDQVGTSPIDRIIVLGFGFDEISMGPNRWDFFPPVDGVTLDFFNSNPDALRPTDLYAFNYVYGGRTAFITNFQITVTARAGFGQAQIDEQLAEKLNIVTVDPFSFDECEAEITRDLCQICPDNSGTNNIATYVASGCPWSVTAYTGLWFIQHAEVDINVKYCINAASLEQLFVDCNGARRMS